MIRRLSPALAALCLLSAVAAPALAADDKTTFTFCDGYTAPGKSTDGMLAEAGLFGKFPPADIEPVGILYGRSGVAKCNAALASPLLAPQYWRRRVNLLQARALHNLAGANPTAALADLDEAAAATQQPNDPWFRRSQGLALDLTRAQALRMLGRTAEARELAMAAWARRPYSRDVSAGALAALGSAITPADLETLNKRLGALDPRLMAYFFEEARLQGRFDRVVALYPQLSPPFDDTRDGWTQKPRIEEVQLNSLRATVYLSERVGPYAYGLVLQGRIPEARRVMAEMLTRVQTEVDKPLAKFDWNSSVAPATVNNLRSNLRSGVPALNAWAVLVEQRALLAEGKVQQVWTWAKPNLRPTNSAGIEFIEALAKALPPPDAALLPSVNAARAQLQRPLVLQMGSAAELRDSLPRPEDGGKIVGFAPARDPVFAMKGSINETQIDGSRIEQEPGAPGLTVMFRSKLSTPTIVTELALLTAADYARRSGADRFYIVRRRDIQHYVVSQAMRSPLSFETDLDIILVKPGETPPVEPWRVFTTAEIIEALAPIYPAPPPKR